MQPDKASAVMAAMIEYRNARATRTGAIPHNETAPVLHRLWLINRFESFRGALLARNRNPEILRTTLHIKIPGSHQRAALRADPMTRPGMTEIRR
jgi:hypothetical protein